MRKRWLIGLIVVVAACAVWALTFPDTVSVSLGKLRHEAFFDGKPTSYWIRGLKQEGFLGHAPPAGDVGKTLREGGSAAVPVLSEIAQNPDEDLRTDALVSLSLIGPEAKAAKPVLAATIQQDKNSARFQLASETLGKIDAAAATEELCAVLRDKENLSRRGLALAALVKLAPECRQALPVLNEMLKDPQEDERLRVEVVHVLWRLQQPAEPLVLALCAMVIPDQSPVGVQCLTVLAEMGPAAKPALPTLLELLKRPKLPLVGRGWGPPHRWAIIRTLGMIGPEARAAVPALIASLKSNNYFIRTEVALALVRMGPAGKEAVAARDAVWWTSITLLAPQPLGNLAVPPLVQVMKRNWIPQEGQTMKAIREAIERIDPGAAARAGAQAVS